MRRTALFAAVTMATALLAGCGTSGSAATGPAPCTTPGFSPDSIKLGWVYPDTGPLAQALGAARSGFVARVEQQNAAGGIHGRKLTFAWRDDVGSGAQNLEAMRDLVENEHVFGVVESTTAAAGGADYLHEQEVPVAGLPAEAIWAEHFYDNMFAHAYVITSGPSVDTFGTFVKARGGTKAAIVLSDTDQVSNQISEKVTDSLRAAGIEVSPTKFIYNPTHTSRSQLGEQLKNAGVDTVAGALSAADTSEVMAGAHEAGAVVKVFLSAAGYDRGVLQEKGATIAGLYTYMNYVPFLNRTPAHDLYIDAMRAYAPELQPPDQELALIAYLSTDIFLTGLLRGPACPTRASYIRTLRGVTDYNAGGLLPGPVDFKNWGQLNLCYTFVRVNDQGTDYELVKDPGGADRWCGKRLPDQ
ncbi:ABC transporter substrate-binding protein [Pseudofrankia sp. EUN1h]|uniref:ABC transporter substrate-binding protein n=1 Tax=Pseudofrankia sp. EUN1h TaxID=1834515 RepID=UPI0002FF88A1|nr:ABC transporter substrate-binding protein [Pseudofrankia sp. EUN1h]